MNLSDCYRVLGLRTGASYEDIKSSYRRLARQYHPDVNPTQQANEKFIQITEAYRALMSAVEPIGLNGRSPTTATTPTPPQSAAPPSTQTAEPKAATKATTAKTAAAKTAAQSTPKTTPKTPAAKTAATHTAIRKRPIIQRDPKVSSNDHKLKETAYDQLQQLLREQRFPRAIALVEGLAQRLPNDLEVRQWQAIAYQRWGRYLIDTKQPEKARIYLNKALRTDPRNRALWFEVDRDMRRIDGIEIF